jgi:hypothetical protein
MTSKGKSPLSNEDFVQAWAASSSIEEAMKRTGLSRSGFFARAARLRAIGVKLSAFPRKRRTPQLRKVDVEALNRLLRHK